MELFGALGLNVKILIAQFVNFAILLFVLYKFGYKPMFKLLEDRKKKIEQGVRDAERSGEKLKEIEEKEKKVLAAAKKEAFVIIEKAKEQAEKRQGEIIKKAKEEVGEIINQEKAKIQQEKAKTLKEIKKEVVDLVAVSLEKILGEQIDGKKDEEIIKKLVSSKR